MLLVGRCCSEEGELWWLPGKKEIWRIVSNEARFVIRWIRTRLGRSTVIRAEATKIVTRTIIECFLEADNL